MKRESGQSLIELAIAIPFLLLVLIGIVDVGRIYHYAISLQTGAGEGAAFAATLTSADPEATLQRVCDAAGLAPIGAPCPDLRLVDSRIGAGGADAFVAVSYDVDLLFGRILGGLIGGGSVTLRASATYPGLAP